jgi:hypothetical protein
MSVGPPAPCLSISFFLVVVVSYAVAQLVLTKNVAPTAHSVPFAPTIPKPPDKNSHSHGYRKEQIPAPASRGRDLFLQCRDPRRVHVKQKKCVRPLFVLFLYFL